MLERHLSHDAEQLIRRIDVHDKVVENPQSSLGQQRPQGTAFRFATAQAGPRDKHNMPAIVNHLCELVQFKKGNSAKAGVHFDRPLR